MDQVLQLAGAVLILVAYVLSQTNRLRSDSVVYLTLNLIGSAILAVLAWQSRQWGFLLLEGTWALVSLGGLLGPQHSGDGGRRGER